MTDEFELLKNNIKSITSQEFNTSFPLCGKIVGNTENYEYCDVEVEMKGGRYTFRNVPAHGFPVPGTSGIIHFHNGNLEQPVCDCAYRLNPSDKVLKEYYTTDCYNWANNGDFTFGKQDYTEDSKFDLVPESNTMGGTQCCRLTQEGDSISFKVNMKKCTTEYFKFQCYYMGNNALKIECYDTDTQEKIQTLPYTLSSDYKIWTSPFGRNGWAYNKEVYPYLTQDHSKTHENIMITITNYSLEDTPIMEYNDETFGDDGNSISEKEKSKTVKAPTSMLIDGILVYSECEDMNYYRSETDALRINNLDEEKEEQKQ